MVTLMHTLGTNHLVNFTCTPKWLEEHKFQFNPMNEFIINSSRQWALCSSEWPEGLCWALGLRSAEQVDGESDADEDEDKRRPIGRADMGANMKMDERSGPVH